MAVALAQSVKANINSASSGTTSGVTTTTGSTFVVVVADANAAVVVSDSKTNTYSQAGTDQVAGVMTGQVWYCQNGTGGASHTATVTFTGSPGQCAFFFLEISGAATASYDSGATVQANDAATPFTATSNVLAQANNVVVSFAFCDGAAGTYSVGGSYTVAQQETNDNLYWTSAVATAVTAATTAQTPSWTLSGNVGTTMGLIIAVFKESGGGGGGITLSQIESSMHRGMFRGTR